MLGVSGTMQEVTTNRRKWAILVGLQVASWTVYYVAWTKPWWNRAQIVLAVVSLAAALWLAIGYRFRWRPLVALFAVLIAGQWNVVLREVALLVWRIRGFAP